MAQRVEIIHVDDIDGSKADENVKFSLDGISYEIDLSAANATKLREAMAPYLGAARSVGGRRPRSKATTAAASASTVRAWAAETGQEVSPRGRIPAHIRKAYELAHA